MGFPRLFSQFILRAFWREKWRSFLAVIGIALGIAVVTAIRLANVAVNDSFRAAVESVGGAASVRIVGGSSPFDELRLQNLAWLEQFGSISPVIEEYAMISDGRLSSVPTGQLVRNELVYVLGVDILRDVSLREYRLLSLDGTDREPTTRELFDLLVDDRAVVLSEHLAKRKGYRVGDSIRLAFGSRDVELVVRGLLRNEGPAKTLRGNFALMDIAAAQLAADRLGRIDYLDIKLAPTLSGDAAEREIRSRLPNGLSVEQPGDVVGRTETMISAFQFNLTALGSVALLVGLFLIYNTISVSVASRRREVGILIATGATRSTVVTLFLGEAALLSIVGIALGLGLGQWLSRAAVQATSQTVETFYIASIAEASSQGTKLLWADAIVISVSSLALALAAAFIPAWRAGDVAPIAIIRGTEVRDNAAPGRRSLLTSVALLLAGVVCTQLPTVNRQPFFGFLAELLFMLGAAFFTPTILLGSCRILRTWLPRFVPVHKQETTLAAANLWASVPQSSVSVAALAMSLGMMIAIGVMVGSFRQTVVYWLDSVLTADLAVRPIMNSSSLSKATIDEEAFRLIREDQDVEALCWYSSRTIPYETSKIRLDTTDLTTFLDHGRTIFKEPANAEARIRQAIANGERFTMVSESFSLRYHKHSGDNVDLMTPQGPVTLTILGVYFDYASNLGTVLLDFAKYRELFGDDVAARSPFGLSLYLRQGTDPETTRDRLAATVGVGRSLYFVTNQQVRREAMRIFESTFTITYALQTIAMLVAGSGVLATLTRLILERQQEISLLSLLGATPRQIRRMIVYEAVFVGLISQLIGIVIGVLLAIVLIRVINVQSFGWTIQFRVPWMYVAQSTAAIVFSSAIFGLIPAFRAAGMDALETVRETGDD